MKSKICVLIPVLRQNSIRNLIDNIMVNTVLPNYVSIIDNSESGLHLSKLKDIDHSIIRPPKPLMINASWNLGISNLLECDFVSILNDDIEIPEIFFEKLIDGFENHPNAGVICPSTTGNRLRIADSAVSLNRFTKMGRREGWAFTVRKKILDKIPPIPEDLRLFFGDGWYWEYVHKLGYGWYLDRRILVYRGIGASVRSSYTDTWAKLQKKERKIWYKYERKFRDNTI